MPRTGPPRFILMPARGGLRARDAGASADAARFLDRLEGSLATRASLRLGAIPGAARGATAGGVRRAVRGPAAAAAAAPAASLRVVDSIGDGGAKLVEMDPESLSALRLEQPDVVVVPERFARRLLVKRHSAARRPGRRSGRASPRIAVRVVSAATGKPLAGAEVVAFTDYDEGVGAQGHTDREGIVRLDLGASSARIERLYVYPPAGHWGCLRKNLTLKNRAEMALTPIDLSFTDCLRHFYGATGLSVGRGVTVGVVDSGSDLDHPDLRVDGGRNTVEGESPRNFDDGAPEGHGTHVAGIIAGRGRPRHGVRGVAPGVTLRAYRVFGKGEEEASNFAIAKAIDLASEDGCDLVNLSLGLDQPDEAVKAAIEDAYARGTVCLAATGNDDRSKVNYPASFGLVLGVGALGRKGTYPAGTPHAEAVMRPYGDDAEDYVAAFSNVGSQVDLIGPGVAVLSTVPGGHAAMDGTSMACPAATGLAAAILAGKKDLLKTKRDADRSSRVLKTVLQTARSMGFGRTYEGLGMLRVPS